MADDASASPPLPGDALPALPPTLSTATKRELALERAPSMAILSDSFSGIEQLDSAYRVRLVARMRQQLRFSRPLEPVVGFTGLVASIRASFLLYENCRMLTPDAAWLKSLSTATTIMLLALVWFRINRTLWIDRLQTSRGYMNPLPLWTLPIFWQGVVETIICGVHSPAGVYGSFTISNGWLPLSFTFDDIISLVMLARVYLFVAAVLQVFGMHNGGMSAAVAKMSGLSATSASFTLRSVMKQLPLASTAFFLATTSGFAAYGLTLAERPALPSFIGFDTNKRQLFNVTRANVDNFTCTQIYSGANATRQMLRNFTDLTLRCPTWPSYCTYSAGQPGCVSACVQPCAMYFNVELPTGGINVCAGPPPTLSAMQRPSLYDAYTKRPDLYNCTNSTSPLGGRLLNGKGGRNPPAGSTAAVGSSGCSDDAPWCIQCLKVDAEAAPINPWSDMRYYATCLWIMIVTMTTIGYGDVTAQTLIGRAILIVGAINGITVVAILVNAVTATTSVNDDEARVLHSILRIELRTKRAAVSRQVITAFVRVWMEKVRRMRAARRRLAQPQELQEHELGADGGAAEVALAGASATGTEPAAPAAERPAAATPIASASKRSLAVIYQSRRSMASVGGMLGIASLQLQEALVEWKDTQAQYAETRGEDKSQDLILRLVNDTGTKLARVQAALKGEFEKPRTFRKSPLSPPPSAAAAVEGAAGAPLGGGGEGGAAQLAGEAAVPQLASEARSTEATVAPLARSAEAAVAPPVGEAARTSASEGGLSAEAAAAPSAGEASSSADAAAVAPPVGEVRSAEAAAAPPSVDDGGGGIRGGAEEAAVQAPPLVGGAGGAQ